ncbi:MAG TPA: hypothetical protein VKG86_07660 [Terracidiphilus sp.]|nr:hypothetical protein [Terracidiphilus sp.]
MKNPEEAIGKVLAGLRAAEASPGMERRILAAVEARASAPPAATPRWAWGVAMAGAAVASLFILFILTTAIHWHGHPSTQAQKHVLPAEPARDAQPATLLSRKPIEFIKAVAPRRTATRIRSEEAVLLSDLRAPSHPAPEAPLTNEEKLLLRVVHSGDPQLIAMLDPEERARQEAKSEAEFQKFVEQSSKEDHESDQITE